MDPILLRNLAREARTLLPAARAQFTRAQLKVWMVEFEALAQTAERDPIELLSACTYAGDPADEQEFASGTPQVSIVAAPHGTA